MVIHVILVCSQNLPTPDLVRAHLCCFCLRRCLQIRQELFDDALVPRDEQDSSRPAAAPFTETTVEFRLSLSCLCHAALPLDPPNVTSRGVLRVTCEARGMSS